MKKTTISWLLVGLLAVMTVLGHGTVAQAGNTISKKEAYRIARTFVPADFAPRGTLDEYKDEEATLCKNNDGSLYWFVLLVRPWDDAVEEAISIAVSLSGDGKQLLKLGTSWRPDHDIMQELRHLIRDKGMFVLWTPEEKYRFRIEWTKKVNDLPPGTMDGENYLSGLLSKKHILPTAHDLSEAKAEEIAIQTIAQKIDLAQFSIAKSFIENAENHKLWNIFFIPNDPMADGWRVDIQSPSGQVTDIVDYEEVAALGHYRYE